MERNGIAHDGDLSIFDVAGQQRSHHIGGRDIAICRLMVFIDANAIKSQAVGKLQLVKKLMIILPPFFRIIVGIGQGNPG